MGTLRSDNRDWKRNHIFRCSPSFSRYQSTTYTNLSYSNFTLAAASNNANNSYYPLELAHSLYFVTGGRPSSLEDDFIKWARSFEGQDIIEKNGYISYTREFN